MKLICVSVCAVASMFFENFRHLTGFRGFSREHGGISKGVLERSSYKNPRKISSRKRRRHVREDCEIFTLDPNKLAEKKQRRLHMGNQLIFRPLIMLHSHLVPVPAPCFSYDRTDQTETRKHWPYPPDTKAFLYYTTLPEKPRIAGELRLRVTSSDDPASFASGSDLLRMNGQPWSRPLYIISKYYIPVYKKLREERLVPDDLDAVLSTFPTKNLIYFRGPILYTLNDAFIVDFSCYGPFFPVITEQGVERLPFRGQFWDNREICGIAPYTGIALARFERSTLPNHKGTRTVVLRFLKIITPVRCVIPDYDGYIVQPKEGELHKRTPYPRKATVESTPQVWSVNIDKPKGVMLRGLRLLWDA